MVSCWEGTGIHSLKGPKLGFGRQTKGDVSFMFHGLFSVSYSFFIRIFNNQNNGLWIFTVDIPVHFFNTRGAPVFSRRVPVPCKTWIFSGRLQLNEGVHIFIENRGYCLSFVWNFSCSVCYHFCPRSHLTDNEVSGWMDSGAAWWQWLAAVLQLLVIVLLL